MFLRQDMDLQRSLRSAMSAIYCLVILSSFFVNPTNASPEAESSTSNPSINSRQLKLSINSSNSSIISKPSKAAPFLLGGSILDQPNGSLQLPTNLNTSLVRDDEIAITCGPAPAQGQAITLNSCNEAWDDIPGVQHGYFSFGNRTAREIGMSLCPFVS